MTPKQRRRIGRYLRHIADELQLRDWTIHVRHDPLDDDNPALAIAMTPYGQRSVSFQFRPDFIDMPPEEQRYVLVHEVLHCHLPSARTDNMWGTTPLLGAAAAALLEERYRNEVEHVVDALAKGIAPSFDLPQVNGKKAKAA